MVKMQCKIVVVLAALLGCFMVGSVSGFTHIVGGRYGWRVPLNLTFFDEWAKPRTFGVGDKLGKLFNHFLFHIIIFQILKHLTNWDLLCENKKDEYVMYSLLFLSNY